MTSSNSGPELPITLGSLEATHFPTPPAPQVVGTFYGSKSNSNTIENILYPGVSISYVFLRRTPNRQSSFSMISNMTSERINSQDDSVCILPDADIDDREDEQDGGEDNSPLFLQVSVSVKYDKNRLENISVTKLLTCLVDVLREHDLAATENFDVDKLTVTLDFVCITLPTKHDELARLENRLMHRSSSIEVGVGGGSGAEKSDPLADPLSKIQRKAVTDLVEDIRWILQDEIIYAKTRAQPISANVVAKVVSHIRNSHNKPGNSVQRNELSFIYGRDRSFDLFKKELDRLTVPRFRQVRSGGYTYFVREAPASAPNEGGAPPAVAADPHPPCPTYWLVMDVSAERLELYFQYRDGEMAAHLPWRQAQKHFMEEVDAAVTRVNQRMLLDDLDVTRSCNSLLEEGDPDDMFNALDNNADTLVANLEGRYAPGHFACGVVWEKRFTFHPRLTVGPDAASSKGVSSIVSTLNVFEVMNRRNMFVYQVNPCMTCIF